MPASSTAAAFVVALKAALTTRFNGAPWSGSVDVQLVPRGDDSSFDKVILLRGPVPVTGGQEYAAMGNKRSDSYDIDGLIVTYSTDPNSDTAFQTSWDRASLILDEIILQLRDNQTLAGDVTQKGRVTSVTYVPLLVDQGGWATRCEYTIEYAGLVS